MLICPALVSLILVFPTVCLHVIVSLFEIIWFQFCHCFVAVIASCPQLHALKLDGCRGMTRQMRITAPENLVAAGLAQGHILK